MVLTKYNHKVHNRKYLDEDDECYYFTELREGGYTISPSNQLVFNFKKPLTEKINSSSWAYRNSAIETYANALLSLEGIGTVSHILIPSPTSKRRNSSQFNNRLDKVVETISKQYPNICIEYSFDIKEDIQSSHLGGSRDYTVLYNNTIFTPFKSNPKDFVVIIDDVLTTGVHFKVCKNKILEEYPTCRVVGIFLALYIKG